jgi:tight adherence protein B
MLGRLLFLTGIQSRLRWEMVRAGVMLWPSELAALAAGTGALGWALGRIALHQNLLGLALAAAGLAGPWLAVGARRGQRMKRLTEQLPPALTMLASSLRSGYSLVRGFQVLAEEMQPPMAEEIQQVLDETYVGFSLEQALTNLAERTQSSDIKLVVTAVQIQSQVGGNLAEILDKTAALIRDRFQLASEVSALTAEGRMSTAILVGMPIGLALIINVLSPGYLNPMLSDPLGHLMLMAASGMLLLGVVIIRKMLDVTI